MVIERRKKILEKYENLSFEGQRLVGITIAKVLLPIINLMDDDNLINLYKYYLNKSINQKNENLYYEYKGYMSEFWKDIDYYDNDIYLSYEVSEFKKYLCFISSEILGVVLMSRKISNINIAINSFIDMNAIIDEYYYKFRAKESVDSLDALLNNISHRTMQNKCEKFLENIIDFYSIGISNFNITKIDEEIKQYSNKLEQILNYIF